MTEKKKPLPPEVMLIANNIHADLKREVAAMHTTMGSSPAKGGVILLGVILGAARTAGNLIGLLPPEFHDEYLLMTSAVLSEGIDEGIRIRAKGKTIVTEAQRDAAEIISKIQNPSEQ